MPEVPNLASIYTIKSGNEPPILTSYLSTLTPHHFNQKRNETASELNVHVNKTHPFPITE